MPRPQVLVVAPIGFLVGDVVAPVVPVVLTIGLVIRVAEADTGPSGPQKSVALGAILPLEVALELIRLADAPRPNIAAWPGTNPCSFGSVGNM